MSSLQPCPACGRHVRAEAACPFCASPRTRRLTTLIGAVFTPVMLAACYGAPPCEDKDLVDTDKDGYRTATTRCNAYDEELDCDDNNAEIKPGAVEIPCDGIDQDCDYTDNVDSAEACDSTTTP